MKVKALILILIFLGLNPGTQANMARNKKFKIPPGFVQIPASAAGASFIIQRQPVSQQEFAAFIDNLVKTKQPERANIAIASLKSAPGKSSKLPVILIGERGMMFYAYWLGLQLSNSQYTVTCQPVKLDEWNTAFGAATAWDQPNQYKLIRSTENEWVNSSPDLHILIDKQGQQTISKIEGAFRLCLTYTATK